MLQQHSMQVLRELASQKRDDQLLLPNQERSDDLNEEALKTKEDTPKNVQLVPT